MYDEFSNFVLLSQNVQKTPIDFTLFSSLNSLHHIILECLLHRLLQKEYDLVFLFRHTISQVENSADTTTAASTTKGYRI